MDIRVQDLFPPNNNRFVKPVTKSGQSDRRVYSTHDELIKALVFQSRGQFSREWIYTDSDGCEVFRVLRFDLADGGKTIRPVCPVGNGWTLGDPSGQLPLYNLPLLSEASVVYVCEGEKCCDAANGIGLIATTSAHGSQSASKTDWTPLAGKTVIILPDNDQPGEKYASQVASILTRLLPPASVKIVRLPELAEHEDIYDFIEKRDASESEAISAEIEQLVGQAETWIPAESAENDESLWKYQPFPTEALPECIRSFIEQGSNALNCDSAYIALPLLAALAGAIGNTRRIVLRRDWIEPCVLWTANVGDSGTLKSPAQDLAMFALRDRHDEAMREYHEEMEQYQISKMEYERELSQWKKSKGNDPPPQPEDEPVPARYLCNDVTVEALAVMLQNQPRGVLLERDELNGWLKSFGAYKSGRGGDDAHWLSMYGARNLTVDRKSGDSKIIYVPRAAVSITGGIQPEILKRALIGEQTENGLAARILMAMPPSRKRVWTEAEVDSMTKAGIDLLFRKLLEFDFCDGEPVDIPLSPEAKAVWVDYYEEHAEASYKLTNTALKAAYSKIEGVAARLTLVIHCVQVAAMEPGIQPDLIDEISVRAGVTMAKWFRGEASRIYEILDIGVNDTNDKDASSLLKIIQLHGGKITPRELQQCSRKYRESKELLEADLKKLIDFSLGRWVNPPPGSSGGRPTRIFELTG
jgi:hypothetical protein